MIPQMHVTSFLTFTLAAVYPAMVAAEYDIKCETSGASPWTEDVTAVINQIKGKSDGPGQSCINHNSIGSYCTTVAKHFSAGLATCNSHNDIKCSDVADVVNALQQKCKADVEGHVRVGGTAKLHGVDIRVFHQSIDGKFLMT